MPNYSSNFVLKCLMFAVQLIIFNIPFLSANEQPNSQEIIFKIPGRPACKKNNRKQINEHSIIKKMNEFSSRPMPKIEKFIQLPDDELKIAFQKEFLPACLLPKNPLSIKSADQLQQLFLNLVAQEKKKLIILNPMNQPDHQSS